jgi:hypothetical protein
MNEKPVSIEEVINDIGDYVFTSTYYSDGVKNLTINEFRSINDRRCEYVMYNHFEFTKWQTRLMGILMGNAFKDETQKTLDLFKKAIENTL